MKFENTVVYGFEGALRGMRNPKNSWNKSDTEYGISDYKQDKGVKLEQFKDYYTYINIGDNDLKLAQTLIRAGSEHRKFLRQIFVSVDITAPLYFWKEADTYKVGTVANSTSTMHKLLEYEITKDSFEMDDFLNNSLPDHMQSDIKDMWQDIIEKLETIRQSCIETKNKQLWKELVRILPNSWLQKRTWTCNYENLLSMCKQRRFHKLNEWSGIDDNTKPNFISWTRTLPYAQELLFLDEVNDGNN